MTLSKRINSCLLVFAFAGCFAVTASAQVDVPESCMQGDGTYTGDLSGDCSYYAFRNETRKVVFFEGDFAKMLDPQTSGGEHTFRDIESDGSFTSTDTNLRGNTATIQGVYSDCGVTGTWRIDFADNSPSKSGTFEMEASAPLPTPSVADLCGTLSTVGFATLAMTMVGTSLIRRRRKTTNRRR